jgi:hypothetical protein
MMFRVRLSSRREQAQRRSAPLIFFFVGGNI